MATLKLHKEDNGELTLKHGDASVRFRHVEVSREKESESWYDRTEVELHLQLQTKHGKVPAQRWVKAVYAYTHGSYDGEDELILEDSSVFGPAMTAASTELSTPMRKLLKVLGPKTPEPDCYRLVVDEDMAWEEEYFSDAVERVK